MKLSKCPKSLGGKHILVKGEIFSESYPLGFTFLARRKIVRIVLRCHGCGMTVDTTPENMKRLKKYFKRK